jgi:hypothetical protein
MNNQPPLYSVPFCLYPETFQPAPITQGSGSLRPEVMEMEITIGGYKDAAGNYVPAQTEIVRAVKGPDGVFRPVQETSHKAHKGEKSAATQK